LNIQKAVRFVEAHGTELEKYRVHFLLGKERNDEIPLRRLRSLQNGDGGFPYKDEKGKATCVNDTNNNLRLMAEFELDKSDVCRKAVEYLFKIQREDGNWNENEVVIQYNPPIWDNPNNPRITMWLTADITNVLIQLGYRNSPAVQKATAFLLRNRDNEGKFAGPLHSTWISIGVFGQLQGSNSDIVKSALNVIEQNTEKLKDGAGDFTWCLECFYHAGIPRENPVAKRCIAELINLQQENGLWVSADGEEYTIFTTLNALKVLKWYKVWLLRYELWCESESIAWKQCHFAYVMFSGKHHD